jgi:iron(III) transport system substrate-binding protein
MSYASRSAEYLPRCTGAFKRLVVAALAAFPLATAALAQTAAGSNVAELATYTGADRTQKLIEGAKKEGTLTIYTSATVEDMNVLMAAFEKKYGIKAKLWRGSSENILQRAVVENRGKRYEADIYETNGSEMEALHREQLLQEVQSPILADLLPQAIMSHREWVGTRLQVITAGYNTNLVQKADLPKSYEDLLDTKWKGKLGIEAEDADWFATVISAMGEERGLELFRKIVATNGVSVRKGHTLLANLVASGEVPLSTTIYLYKLEQYKKNGAPIDSLVLPPTVARVNGIGLARQSPHPYAALLFFDFMLTDGQEILAQRDFFPTNPKIKPLPSDLKLTFVNSAKLLDEGAKWDKLYKQIVLDHAATPAATRADGGRDVR